MTKGTFGESLKREREMRAVTLDEISAATRIATRFLRAIENEEWSELPGGVFNRGFVRAVARYLGLDEENIVAEYNSAIDERPSVPVWTGSPPAVTPQQPWLAWIIAAILVIALLAAGWFGTERFLGWRATKRAAETPAAGADSADTSANLPPETSADPSVSGNFAAPANNQTAPEPFQLKIEASTQTEVTIVADRDVVFDRTMMAGETHSYWAADHFQISAKDAGAVHLKLNGKTVPPFGSSGQPVKITLTRDAIKGASGGGN
jgi:cytoskeletal protein RodZ